MQLNIKIVEKSNSGVAFINLVEGVDIMDVLVGIAEGKYQLRSFTNKQGGTSYVVEKA